MPASHEQDPGSAARPTTSGEVERKVRVPDDVAPPPHASTYVDTPDLRLLRWGVSLRRGEGGADEGWHLQLPVSGSGVGLVGDEVTLPLAAGSPGNVPPELADVVTALVRGARLGVVATIRTSRVPTVPPDAGGVPPETVSELVHALAPHGLDPPDVVVPPEPRAQDPVGATLQWVLASGVRTFLLADIAVRRQLPDAVHALRVSARTLRSALRTFGPVLDAAWARPLRSELAWAAGEMGTARDTEVFLARLESVATRLPADERAQAVRLIEATVRGRLDAAREASLVALRSDRYLHLLTALVEAAREPGYAGSADVPAASLLPGLVDRATRRLAERVGRLTVASPPAEWHRVRVLAKRARYLAEAAAPVLGQPARRQAAALERVTELLGSWHDSVVSRDMLRELATRPGVDGRAGYLLELLDAVEAEREAAERAAFPAVWERVGRVLRRYPLQ